MRRAPVPFYEDECIIQLASFLLFQGLKGLTQEANVVGRPFGVTRFITCQQNI